MRRFVAYPGEDNYWVVEYPSLPGCISHGESRAEALENIKKVIEAYIAALEEDVGGSLRSHRYHACNLMSQLPAISERDCVNA